MSESILQKRPHLIPAIVASLMLLGALADWPYGYYQLLRFVVCIVAVYVAFIAYNWHKIWATCIFGFTAVLFNPLIPIHLSREIWQPIDVIWGILFILSAVIVSKPIMSSDKKNY